MKIKITCYETEVPEITYRLKQVFDVTEISKFNSNTRGTNAIGISDGYIFVTVKDFDKETKHLKADFVAYLVKDMLQYLDTLHKVCGYDADSEIDNLRSFYMNCGKIDTQQKLLELINAWKIALIERANPGQR